MSAPENRNQAQEKIVQWLSPRSDHFPTPRGFHFLSAPILPSSPSSASIDESSSPSSSFTPWNRTSTCTDVTEFDDIYDISEDDEDTPRMQSKKPSLKRQSNARTTPKRNSAPSPASLRALPKLMIPASQEHHVDNWSARPDFKKLMSPVPPTPPAKVEMSPAVRSFLHAQQSLDVPTISAPPSLDGSLSSEQMAAMSAPPTPVIGADDDLSNTDWSGVRLQPGALATLRALSGASDVSENEYQNEQVIEIPEESAQEMRQEMSQQTPRAFTSITRPALRLSTGQQQSLSGLTRLEIPSPGGFFSGLSPRTRHTWHLPSMMPDDVAPPTSTTAEQFYRCPWNDRFAIVQVPAMPVEQVVEVRPTMSDGMPTARPVILEQVVEANDDVSDGLPTARRVPEVGDTSTSSVTIVEPASPNEATVVATEIVADYDPEYTKKQHEEALSNLDRTELWLMAQKAYLKGVSIDDVEPESAKEPETVSIHLEDSPRVKTPEPEVPSETAVVQKKKTVRFSEIVVKTNIPRSLPSKICRQESAYYRAFQDYVIRSRSQDPFVHRLPRFEAMQAQRVSLRESHRNQLLGKFQLSVVPQSAKKRMSANVARGDDVLVDDPEKLKREKEAEALTQMAASTWHVNAVKTINGGRLFSAPLAKQLARLSRMHGANSRTRILDLGGQAACDWAWHCAIMYPNTKVYTATTKAIRQLANSNIRGPPNHRQVAVERLTRLPFPESYFDLVSARELYSILKFVGENGEDEWETCLKECMRVLKPGGYLEFSVLDSDIMNAGPMGLAKSVEFGFSLKTMGYDPNPTKLFLGRLHRAGFEDVRRAWMCLPMGEKRPANRNVVRDSQGCEVKLELEAMVTGSTEATASVCGIAGGWAWERWLLRCEMEKVACEGRLVETAEIREAGACLDGVHGVIEEGRQCGAGWRVLNGFARKPTVQKELVSIALVR
ncbi:methyltransferase domain-containing protein [Pseudomassariella vexata]|uniref:Methyltransferase domain-containing protein n=1 Tax=Pseudomassariella vexata TaxID=1141098 RepID=A0A1Y2E488_9PEZI|nr:methyltransferase domain-containing protein [Pseudomassariella vexata]ORY66371.1 methyltransferase domain-containing protein [Pseudomassariella vexata]